MSEKPPSTPPPARTPPPVLKRVQRAGATGAPAGAAAPAPAAAPPAPEAKPAPAAAPPAPEAKPAPAPVAPPAIPAGSHGLDAPEVTAAAAVAARLPAEGPLARESALHLYYLAVATQATGRLHLGGEKGSHALTFKKGVVEHAASTHAQDDLGQFLVRKGVLDAGKLAQAEAARASHGGDLVAALSALRLFDPAAQFQVLQEHGGGLVWRALSAETGTWRWEPGVAPPPSSFPLGSRWGMLCDAVRRFDGPAVKRRLGPRAGWPAVRTGGRVALADLKLTPRETRVAGLFDGLRSPAEIAVGQQPADADLVLRLALLLGETELLGFAEPAPPAPAVRSRPPPAAPAPKPATASPRPPAAPAAKAAAPARPPDAPAPRQPGHAQPPTAAKAPAAARAAPPPMTLAALHAAHERMKDADHFEVLGVRREASPAQIKVSYFQLAKAYHPDSALLSDPPEAKQLRADLFARIGEAWSVLGDDVKRARYIEQLASGGAAEVDVMAILQAEQIFQLAAVLVRSRKYEEALKKLDECIRLNANEAEFAIWKAWVQFLLAPADRRKARSVESTAAIEAGLKANPRCTPGYLFLGQMAKLMGDAAAAERHFKRGLAVDEKNVDLQRELKYLKK